jgi:hypothetical protein
MERSVETSRTEGENRKDAHRDEGHRRAKGKIRKKYRYEDMMAASEKFRSLPQNESYLRLGLTLEQLDAIASAQSDNEAGMKLQKARQKLFQTFNKKTQRPAA